MKFILLFFILIFSTNLLSAQSKKIIKIIDSNLFLLEDSTFIKLAGIDIPSRYNQNEQLKEIADEVYNYAQSNLLNRSLEIIVTGNKKDNPNFKLVIINKNFLLSKMNVNQYFLERGFGKFSNNSDSVNEVAFVQSEKIALENKYGIWKLGLEVLNQKLDKTQLIHITEKINQLDKNVFVYDRNALRVLFEIPVGLGTGIATAIPFFFQTLGVDDDATVNTMAAFGYLSFIAGNALGVYLIAKGGNKDLSYGYTFLSSLITGTVGLGVYSFLHESDRNLEFMFPALFPLIGALIYVNAIGYPQKYEAPSGLDFQSFYNPTHYQFYNHTSLKMSLFRINF